MKNIIVLSLVFCFWTQTSFAQKSTSANNSLRRGVATVMFAGLAGAVLGLSTLSFYGEPQEHIGNIWTGLAIGVVSGSVYVLSRSSTTPSYEATKWPTNPHQLKLAKNQIFSYSLDF